MRTPPRRLSPFAARLVRGCAAAGSMGASIVDWAQYSDYWQEKEEIQHVATLLKGPSLHHANGTLLLAVQGARSGICGTPLLPITSLEARKPSRAACGAWYSNA